MRFVVTFLCLLLLILVVLTPWEDSQPQLRFNHPLWSRTLARNEEASASGGLQFLVTYLGLDLFTSRPKVQRQK